MPWGRKFWQGTLYPSNNLEQAKPWFQLIKQKSLKMIGSFFLGIKFLMLDLTTCIIKNCSLLQKFNLHSDLKIPHSSFVSTFRKCVIFIGGLSSKPPNENVLT